MSPGVSETALLWPPSTDPQKRPNILPIHTTPDIKIPKLRFTTGSTERLYLLLQISQTDSRASPPPHHCHSPITTTGQAITCKAHPVNSSARNGVLDGCKEATSSAARPRRTWRWECAAVLLNDHTLKKMGLGAQDSPIMYDFLPCRVTAVFLNSQMQGCAGMK